MTRPRRWTVLAVLALGLAAGACASGPAHLQVDQSDAWIRAEWEMDAPEGGGRRISGYVYNTRNYYAGQVRLLVEAFDGAEQPVDRRYQWLPGGVPPNNRAYFEVRGLPAAERYRVSVPYYTWYDDARRGFFGIRF